MMKIKSNKYTKYAIMQLSKAYLHVVWVFFLQLVHSKEEDYINITLHHCPPLSEDVKCRFLSTSVRHVTGSYHNRFSMIIFFNRTDV